MRFREAVVALSILFSCMLVMLMVVGIRASSKQQASWLLTRRVVEFRIDSSFSTQEIFLIQRALKEWEISTNGYVKLNSFVDDVPFSEVIDWKKDGISTIYNAQSVWSWERAVAKYREDPDVLGVAIIASGDIFIVEKRLFKTVILHEIGHVLLGHWHSDQEEELMYPEVGEEKSISEREALFVQIFTR